jgi:hypothetical protein
VSLKDTIRAASDLPRESLHIPEWNVSLFVKTMTGTERDAWEESFAKGRKVSLDKVRARLAVAVCCDENGQAIFSPDDVDWLSEKSCSALQRIFAKASKLNALSNSEMDELAKN